MNRTNSCCINEMEQLILMSLVEIRFTSISQFIQNHTNYWHTHKTREFQGSHTSDIATHHPKCSVDSLSPSAISQSHFLFLPVSHNDDGVFLHLQFLLLDMATPSSLQTIPPHSLLYIGSHHPTQEGDSFHHE